jgi:hypothetical protein
MRTAMEPSVCISSRPSRSRIRVFLVDRSEIPVTELERHVIPELPNPIYFEVADNFPNL